MAINLLLSNSPDRLQIRPGNGPSVRCSCRGHTCPGRDRWCPCRTLENISAHSKGTRVTLMRQRRSTGQHSAAPSSPDTSRPSSWRDTCRSPRYWRGGRPAASRRPLARRHGATPSEPTGSEEPGSGGTPGTPAPSSAPPETPRYLSGHDGSFPGGRGEKH